MKIVLAFDKFKGSATSQQLNDAVQQALSDDPEIVELFWQMIQDLQSIRLMQNRRTILFVL